jgi:two-component system sensor histidine kinase TctE
VSAGILRSDPSDAVFFQVLRSRGEWVAGDRDLPVPDEPRAPAGELRFRDEVQGRPVRVAYLWLTTGIDEGDGVPPMVQVAETLDKRA